MKISIISVSSADVDVRHRGVGVGREEVGPVGGVESDHRHWQVDAVEQVGVRRVGEDDLGVGARDVGRQRRTSSGRVQPDHDLPADRGSAEQERELRRVVQQHPDVGRCAAGNRSASTAERTTDWRTTSAQVQEWSSKSRPGRSSSARASSCSRTVVSRGLGGECTSDRQRLLGRAAEEELEALRRREVAVRLAVEVDADPAVHVDGGVREPVTGVGGPAASRSRPRSRRAGPRRAARRPPTG